MKLDERQKIIKILTKRAPKLAEKLLASHDIMNLDHDLRYEIAGILSDEFSEYGLREDDEPNAYGLEIEHLIGACRLTEE